MSYSEIAGRVVIQRCRFVKNLAILSAAASALKAPRLASAVPSADDITAAHIPRWRGFNLQGRFGWPGHPYDGPAFDEFDFATMAEWASTSLACHFLIGPGAVATIGP